MEQEGNLNRSNNGVYSKRLRAGRRRTYFFDVRTTKSNDYYLTITESKKRYNEDGYERHKLFLYKEDFNKFIEALQETVDHVKTELLPEYDFDEFSRRDEEYRPPQDLEKTDEKKPEEKIEEADTPADAKDAKDAKDEKVDEEEKSDEVKAETVEMKADEKLESKDEEKSDKGDKKKKKEKKSKDESVDVNEEDLKWD